MRRLLLLLLFMFTGALAANAQQESDVVYLTAPEKVCWKNYASVRAFRYDKTAVDRVEWTITIPGVPGTVTQIGANARPAGDTLFRYIGPKGQSLTLNLHYTGTYILRATVINGRRTNVIEKYIVVEDCTMEVCKGDFKPTSDFTETFGQFAVGDNARKPVDASVATIEYQYNGGTSELADNWYSVHWNSRDGGKQQWDYVEDHTGDGRGGMLIANSAYEKKTFYKRLVTGLCPGARYNFSAWFINLNSREVLDATCQNTDKDMANNANATPYRYAGVTFIIRNATTNAIIKQFNTNDVSMDLSRPDMTLEQQRFAGWQQFGGTVELAGGQESVWVEIKNNNPGGCGNDIAIDDIAFKYCAPLIYSYIDGENVTENLVCPGADLTLTSEISPAGYFVNPIYSWEINKQDGAGWQTIPVADPLYTGANTPTLHILPGTLPEKNVYLYRVMVIEAGNLATGKQCYTPSNYVTLTILEMPKLTSAGRICQGDMTKLTANYLKTPTQDGYETFTFTGTDIVPWPEAGPQPANEIYVQPNQTTTYTVAGTVQYGKHPSGIPRICTRVTSAEVIVDERPVVTLGDDMKVCVNTPITLDAGAANAGYGIKWLPGGQTTQTINVVSPATGNTSQTYEVSVTNGVCLVKDEITITSVRTIPAVITTINPGCVETTQNLALTASLETGYTATWEIVGDAHGAVITPNPANPNAPTLTSIPLNTRIRVKLTVTATGTACSTTTERDFLLETQPVATASSITQCSPDFVMNANTPDATLGQTGQWTILSGTPANIVFGDITDPHTTVKLLNGMTTARLIWTVSPDPASTCPPTSAPTVVLTVQAPPVISALNVERCLTPAGGTFTVPFTQTGAPTKYDLEAVTPLSGFTDKLDVTVSGTSFSIPYDAAAVAGTYTFRITARKTTGTGTICETERFFTITIFAPSTAPSITVPTVDICKGEDAQLTVDGGTLGTNAEWVWYTGSCTGGTEVRRGQTVTVSPATTTTYYVKAVSATGPCAATTCASVTVRVFEEPAAPNAGPDQEHCNVPSFQLAGSQPSITGAQGTWTWPGTLPAGAGISDIHAYNAIFTLPAGASGESITLTWTMRNGPCETAGDEVTLINRPAITGNTINANQTICEGTAPLELTGLAATGGGGTITYQWQSSTTNTAGSFTNISGATGANYQPGTLNTTTYYRRVVTAGICSHTSNVVTITVPPTPEFTIESPIDACNASGKFDVKYQVQEGTPVTYDLIAMDTKLPGFVDIMNGSLPSSPITINYPATTAAGTYSFRIVMRDVNGCYSSKDFTVTLESLSVPAWIEATPSRVCEGDKVILTAKGGNLGSNAEWVWYLGDCDNGTFIQKGGSIEYTLTETTTFAVRAESDRACKNSVCATLEIIVDEMPDPPNAGVDQDHCDDPNFVLDGSAPSITGATGRWSWTGTLPAGVTISDITDPHAAVVVPAGSSATFIWTITNGACTTNGDPVTLTNRRPLTNNTITAAQSICPGTAPNQLTGSTPSGGNGIYTYQWQSSLTNVDADFTDIPNATGINYAPGNLSVTTYYRRMVTAGVCSAPGNVIAITVSVTPEFTVQNVAAICNTATSFQVSYVVDKGVPIRYDLRASGATVMPGFVNIINANLTGSPLTVNLPTGTAAGIYNFTLTLRDATGCESTQSFTVTVEIPSEAPTVDPTPVEICIGDEAILKVEGDLGTGAKWVWYTVSCGGTKVGEGASITVKPATTTTYFVRAESTGPCGNTTCANITVNVFEVPSTAVAGDDQVHCDNTTFTLAATAPTVGTGKWSWTGALPAGASISDVDLPNATVTLPAGESITLTWTVDNGPCAESTDQVTLTNLRALTNNTISASQEICPGGTPNQLTGTTPQGGNGSYTYQWQISTTGAAGSFTDIAGATNDTYAPGALNATTYYRRVVRSGALNVCSENGNIVTITVAVVPAFTVSNVAAICNTAGTFTVNYAITAGTPETYTLKAAGNRMPGFTDITGAALPTPLGAITAAMPANIPAGVYNFELTLINGIGCESTQSFTVTVEIPSEAPTVEPTPVEICIGDEAILKVEGDLGTGAKWVWYTVSCGGTKVGEGTSITVKPAITTTYYVRAESTGPCGNTICATITVNVFEVPSTAVAGDDQVHCDNATFTLAATAPTVGTGKWSWTGALPAGASISDVDLRNATVTLPAGESITLTWTVDNGPCAESTDQVTLTNLRPLTNNTISANQEICPGTAPNQLTGTVPSGGNGTYTYQWQSSLTNVDADFTDIPNATGVNYAPGNLTATTYYRRVVTAGVCSAPGNVITITVSVTPAFTAQNVAAICNTASGFTVNYAITAGTPQTYTLKAAGNRMPGFTDITGAALPTPLGAITATMPANTPAGVYDFELTLINDIGCESTQSFTVTVEIPSEEPTVDDDQLEICVGDEIELKVEGDLGTGAEWVWYTVSCGGTEEGRGATLKVSPSSTTTYYVRAESAGPCGNTACIAITVNVFEVPSTAVAGDDQVHCNNATFTLAATAPTVGTGKWSWTGALPIGASISDVNLRNATVTLPAGETVTLTWTVDNGPCAESTDQVTLTNLESLTNNTISANQEICPGGTPKQLTGTTPQGGNGAYTYQWQMSTTGAAGSFTDIAGATNPDYTPGALNTTTYFRRMVESGVCSEEGNMVTITVAVVPAFTVSNVAAICNTAGTFTINYNITAGEPETYTLKASGNRMPGFTDITGAALPTPLGAITATMPANTPAGVYDFELTLINDIGCESTQTFTVTVEAPSTITTIDKELNICIGDNVTLQVEGTLGTGAQWVWHRESCTGPQLGTGASLPVSPTVTTTYYVRAESAGPCGNSTCVAITVNVVEMPSTAVAGDDQVHCDNATFTLAATAPTVGTGKWSGALPNGASISDVDLRNATVTLPAGETVTLAWTVANSPCAVSTDQVTLTNLRPLKNNTITADQVICPDEDAAALTGSTPEDGTGTYTYKWEMSTTGATTGFTEIAGATGISYDPGQISQTTWFRRIVLSTPCESTSNTVEIRVSMAVPVVVTQGANKTAECVTGTDYTTLFEEPVFSHPDGFDIDVDHTDVTVPNTCGFTITRTWTATDECGKTTTVSQSIEVRDTKAPVFNGTLPADLVAECSNIPPMEVLTARDDCSSATVTPEETPEAIPGACANNYRIIRKWTATDVCGNTVTHTQVITVQDKTAPVFTTPAPAAVTVECDAIPEFVDIAVTDNCSSTANITVDKKQERTNGACANSYTLTRTWTAKDECGNETTVTQVITVTDTQAPVFTDPTPANITVECSEIPGQQDLEATDNCSPAEKVAVLKGETRHPIPGACANNYLLVRTWTAMDECKNARTITQTITVIDNRPPTFTTTTPADVTVECDAIPEVPEMKATDLCSVDKVTVDYKQERVDAPGACANNYQLIRTWTATDECDNKTIVSQTITVRDTKAPEFTSAAPANVEVECNNVPGQPDLKATDNCSVENMIRISKNERRIEGNCANNYQLVRTWTAVDECGNETVLTQTITVTDKTKPYFTTTVPADATVDCNSIPGAPVMEAGDNCSPVTAIRVAYNQQHIDIPGACANNYKLLRTWTATDECGNATTVMQVITVTDRTAPQFTSAAPADATVECNAIPGQPDLMATDNCSVAENIRIVKNETRENIAGACVNNYRLIRTWTATDECGNSTTLRQVITVQDRTPPTFTLPVPMDATVECNAIPAQPMLTATDNCTATANVTIDRAETKEPIPGACVNNYRLVRTWTAKDECGNTTVLTQVLTVVDNTAPTFTMPVPANATVECNAIPAQPVLTVTDNCSATNRIAVVRNEVKEMIPGACVNNYRLIRSWTATDECGNKTMVEQVLTVVDNTRPTFTGSTPADATVECSAIPAQQNLSVTDNCTPSNLVTVVKNERREDIPGACVNNYRLIRTWTATDECGNSTTVQQVLTVVDRTAPSFVTAAPANATVECSSIPAQPDLSAMDNCSGTNVTVVKAERRENIPGACVNNYRLIRTWTATDECGNSKTVEQVLTVTDRTKPVFTTAAPANATVECSAIPAQPDLMGTDNCSAANNIRIVKNETRENIAGTCMNNYRLIRTWTATDECGNNTTVQQVLTVQDKTPPVFTLLPPANVSASCDAVPAAPVMTATDNCSANNVTVHFSQVKNYLSGCQNNYRLTRTWTATDECGNIATATQVVTVTDDIAPVFTMPTPTDMTVNCNAVPQQAVLTATDNCSRPNKVILTREQRRENIAGACVNNYRLINIWRATDECGNTSEVRQVITVQDTTRPVIATPPADIIIRCGAAIPTGMIELAVTDNCDVNLPRVRYTVDPYVKDLCNGYTIIRRWKASDRCGNAANDVIQRIIVQPCPKPALAPAMTVNCSSNPFITLTTQGQVNRPSYTLVSVTPANAVQAPLTSSSNRFNLNGATSATFIVRDGITGCASDPVTYNISYLQMPKVDLGRDTSLCGGNGMVLDAGPANFGYTIRWSTGETTQRIRVTKAGKYTVTVSNGMCTATDDINIGVIPMPLVNLPDMTICRGQNVKLDATVAGATYLWSTGATTPSINVSTQETFWVRVMKNGCITIDTINVTVNPPPDITLSRDTSICPGQSVMLTVNTNAGRIQWGNGETGNSIMVSKAGSYSVSVYRDNCVVKEQVRVTERPNIQFELGPDRIICPGGSILVDARHPDAASYRWSDGDVNPVKSFTQSGTYVLGLLDRYCDRYKSDSIKVTVAGAPTLNLGSDTTICKGRRFILKANAQNATSYRWSNGHTGPYIEVSQPGTYSVTAYNDCGSATDEITIDVKECSSKPDVPNAFSPNGDGKNDVFRPIVRGPMYDYELRIFNRWGELVYLSRDQEAGWDGTYKGQPVDVGTFVWWLSYKKSNNGPSFIIKGDVVVVR